jgi:hypothetical protein
VRSSERKTPMLDEASASETLPDKTLSSFSLLITSNSSEEPEDEKSMSSRRCYPFLHFDVVPVVKEMDVPQEGSTGTAPRVFLGIDGGR